jgi:hypothetical protein
LKERKKGRVQEGEESLFCRDETKRTKEGVDIIPATELVELCVCAVGVEI